MPRIGTGLAGGNWETVSQLIREELCAKDIPVTVYELAAASSLQRGLGRWKGL
jgi:hypothetical protein